MRPLSYQRKRVYGRVYSIGIYAGPSPLALAPDGRARNPVLTRDSITDHLATFVADPFMTRVDGQWHMFFETMSWRSETKKGEIAHATSRDGFSWEYREVVLAEPFHLSYPYLVRDGDQHFMIPEAAEAGAIRLYQADPFPSRWRHVGDLLVGGSYRDSCIFRRDGRWWILTHTDEQRGTLRLFHAASLTGAWREHPRSPVVAADRRIARPAGRVVEADGRLVRFAQDCRSTYGASVLAFEITRLTPDAYEEVELTEGPVLAGVADGWNRGMHHVDPHQLDDGTWIACVDGWQNRVRRPREIARWALDRLRRRRMRPDSDEA